MHTPNSERSGRQDATDAATARFKVEREQMCAAHAKELETAAAAHAEAVAAFATRAEGAEQQLKDSEERAHREMNETKTLVTTVRTNLQSEFVDRMARAAETHQATMAAAIAESNAQHAEETSSLKSAHSEELKSLFLKQELE